jgi:hypothetical protein
MADNIYACSRCRKRFRADGFKTNRLGERHKTCIECSQRKARDHIRTQCEHKRRRAQCIDCDGSAICEHKRQRASCYDCGGSATCEHKRQRNLCIDCGGSSTCEHKRQRRSCFICEDPAYYIEHCISRARWTKDWAQTPPGLDFTAVELLLHILPQFTPGMTLEQRNWRIAFVVPLDEGKPTHDIRLERMRLPNIKITPLE